MRKIEYSFISLEDAEMYRRMYGLEKPILPTECNAIIKEENNVGFCSRKEIINYMRQASRQKKFIRNLRMSSDFDIKYVFELKLSDGQKGRIEINIPTYLFNVDHNLSNEIKELDLCVEIGVKNIKNNIKKCVALATTGAVLVGAGSVAAFELTKLIVTGAMAEFDHKTEQNREYVDDVLHYGRQQQMEQMKNGGTYDYETNTYYPGSEENYEDIEEETKSKTH